ncbi:MAG: SLBB domain-containing protein, partial [Saprospiraceae bacterium]|nr:SLBB domain-containing protein [Saprospiraceae bacterium]
MHRLIPLLMVIFLVCLNHLSGQVSESFLRQQLIDRNIDEAVFRQKLKDRGVAYDSLEEVPVERYDEVEKIVNEILAEMEAGEGSAPDMLDLSTDPAQIIPEATREVVEDVKESVIEGSTIEEAVAEELQEEEVAVPPARIYGQEIFRNKTLKVFRQADNIKPRDSYRLGAGDEVTISIWGVSVFERTFTIDENGYIKPDLMPRIFLKDLTFKAGREKLKSTFARFMRFNDDQFEVSLRFARTISVGIFGEVFSPGNHTISAINSAFNALVAAGGPSDIGSIRNIKWIKSDGDVRSIDVYEYMADPTIAQNFYLAENDIIQVPLSERVVEITGAVRRPLRYELIPGEELEKLIEYAGGFRPDAYREILQLRRFENDQQKVLDINYNQLSAQNGDFSLRNGDILSIRTIPSPYRNFIQITGTVELPGEYEFTQGMRISDLLDKGKLMDESERSFAVLRRNNRDGTYNFERINLLEILQNPASAQNLLLAPSDQLTIYARGNFVDSYEFDVSGQVRKPGIFAYDPSQNLRVRDAVLMAGGLSPGATDFAYIIRRDLETQEPEYISIQIKSIMADAGSPDNLILLPGDQLRIQSKATYLDQAVVRIDGAVRAPGSFPYDGRMTMRDLILLASGLRMEAATNRVEVSRLVIEQNSPTKVIVANLELDDNHLPEGDPDFKLEPYDQIFVRMVPEFEFQKTVNLDGEVRFPGPYNLITDNETISSVIKRAGGITAEGFPEGASLTRSQGPMPGPIVIELD